MRSRSLAIALLTLAFTVAGTGLVLACGWGWPDQGAGHHEYGKPGCGPDKSDGWAGKSGQHTGQPPKDQHRGDCPHPPGQNCDDKNSNKFVSNGNEYGSSGNKHGSDGGSCSKHDDGHSSGHH